jgi:CubicO group peptidase (beta-lactamase class C family)
MPAHVTRHRLHNPPGGTHLRDLERAAGFKASHLRQRVVEVCADLVASGVESDISVAVYFRGVAVLNISVSPSPGAADAVTAAAAESPPGDKPAGGNDAKRRSSPRDDNDDDDNAAGVGDDKHDDHATHDDDEEAETGAQAAADDREPLYMPYSVTKGVVGATAVALVDAGLLHPDRPVADVWPSFKFTPSTWYAVAISTSQVFCTTC